MSKRYESKPGQSGKREYAKHGMRTGRIERRVTKLLLKKTASTES